MKIHRLKQMNGVAPNSKRTAMRGFTLIELLVVIAIIAILAAMLLPVLARTKLKATQATCISNQKQLMLAFMMFSAENDDQIVPFGSATGEHNMDGYIRPDLAPGGITWATIGQTADQAMANLTKALAYPGVDPLYKYAQNVGVIHCPGDTRFKFNAPGRGWAYDSYSKPESIAGETYNNWWGQGSTYTKLAAISAPSDTFAFVEDVDSRGYNVGTWTLNWQATTAQAGHPQSFTWEDPLPMYHGNVSTFAFADGHAEAHTWGDGALINFGKLVAAGGAIGNQPNPPNYRTADYEYIYQGFRFPTWQQ